MNCHKCASDYFAESMVCQTNHDGRIQIFASDQDHMSQSAWIKHLTCIQCGCRYLVADKGRSKNRLVDVHSAEAAVLLHQDRQDFTKSFDPRQNQEEAQSAT